MDQKNNSGNWNSGNRNSGDLNSGNWNSGDLNSGDLNSGNWNSGNRNSGNRNSGDLNSGNRNSGDLNSGNWNSGFFCTNTPSPMFFDEPTNMTWDEAYSIIPYVDLPVGCRWIPSDDMTDEEKSKNPNYATIGGYLKILEKRIQDAFPIVWAKMTKKERAKWTSLPNFDAEKFFKCTGVDVRVKSDAKVEAKIIPDSVTIDGVVYVRSK